MHKNILRVDKDEIHNMASKMVENESKTQKHKKKIVTDNYIPMFITKDEAAERGFFAKIPPKIDEEDEPYDRLGDDSSEAELTQEEEQKKRDERRQMQLERQKKLTQPEKKTIERVKGLYTHNNVDYIYDINCLKYVDNLRETQLKAISDIYGYEEHICSHILREIHYWWGVIVNEEKNLPIGELNDYSSESELSSYSSDEDNGNVAGQREDISLFQNQIDELEQDKLEAFRIIEEQKQLIIQTKLEAQQIIEEQKRIIFQGRNKMSSYKKNMDLLQKNVDRTVAKRLNPKLLAIRTQKLEYFTKDYIDEKIQQLLPNEIRLDILGIGNLINHVISCGKRHKNLVCTDPYRSVFHAWTNNGWITYNNAHLLIIKRLLICLKPYKFSELGDEGEVKPRYLTLKHADIMPEGQALLKKVRTNLAKAIAV